MTEEEILFNKIGEALPNAEKGKLFGKSCFKVNKKAFVCFFENEMVFKLSGDEHNSALGLENAVLFDPSKKKRPMKEWVQLSAIHRKQWQAYAIHALNYVEGLK